jgi:hypothetical protein
MRLLDRVAQSTHALGYREHAVAGPVRLASAADWAHVVRACPTRFVLTDPLTALCTSLAYADGDRLHGCLDLVRLPAELLWVEWNDAARIAALPAGVVRGEARPGPAGALLHATPDGRSGRLRTFWADGTDGPPHLSAIETWFDLDAPSGPATPGPATDAMRVVDPSDPALDALYALLRFRLEPSWARYYRQAGLDADAHAAVVHACLEGVVRDLPMLFALFLLTNARQAVRRLPVTRAAINRLRAARGEPELLDHVEVHASVFGEARAESGASGARRRAPRLHHVRGHLVRRQDRVYWRVPHLRGHAAAGHVRSRTVTLRFAGERFSPDPSLR